MKRNTIAKRLAMAAVACTLAFTQPAAAAVGAHFGGGGFHGGGFGGGGFHGGGFHGDGFHGDGFHGDGFHGDGFHGGGFHGDFAAARHPYYGGAHGYHGAHGWWGGGFGIGLATPYVYGEGWYCGDPPGYYPYVTQCYSGWDSVPAY
jgi:hypothetical protein